MPDLQIRGLSAEVVAALDRRAARHEWPLEVELRLILAAIAQKNCRRPFLQSISYSHKLRRRLGGAAKRPTAKTAGKDAIIDINGPSCYSAHSTIAGTPRPGAPARGRRRGQ